MAEEDDSQKSEEPTERKLSKAKEKGQVPSSEEVKSAMILLGGTIGVVFMAPRIMNNVRLLSMQFIERPEAMSVDTKNIVSIMAQVVLELALTLAPFMGVLMVLALVSSIVQNGLIWAPEKIKPDFSKLSLIKGIKSKFSGKALVEFLKGIFKLVVVSLVSFGLAMPMVDDLTLMPSFEIIQTLDRIYIVVILLSAGSIAVMTVLSILDFAYTKYSHRKQMMMSKQEVKDENKQTEGDPAIKSRIRQLRKERAQQRMMAAVPEADVVITNPTHYSVALEYKMDKMKVPKLVAKGVDSLAFRIREGAKEHDIPIVENPPLARVLYAAVELDEEVPEEHYKAVAEVIGYVMKLRGDSGQQAQK